MRNSVIVMEDLTSLPTVAQRLRSASDDNQRREILSLVTQLVLQLYRAGCNHVDVNDGNILICPDNRQVRIIDLQYARFLHQPSPTVLMAQAARFRLSCVNSHSAEEAILDEWLISLLAAAGLRKEDGWLDLHHRFFTWPLSLRERLKLK
jgi:tRNA A-37 threonylcarbamoyl transferase component Bud32